MLILRMISDIKRHFPSRRSEWVSSGMLMGWGVLLYAPPEIFATSPSFEQMARMANESTWGLAAAIIGWLRFVALTVNGTLSHTRLGRWTPHGRALMSMASASIWLNVTIGLVLATSHPPGLAVYFGLMVLDIMNALDASVDAGKVDGAKANGYT